MRCPEEWYQMQATLAQYLPQLRPAQRRGLAWWVYGTILAGSACQTAVLTALSVLGGGGASQRQALREWTYAGAAKAAPCATQVEVDQCFAPLLRWVLRWWRAERLALAVDATLLADRWTALVISVVYRGCAIPVAWHILPANQAGEWMPHFLRLLRVLRPAVPPRLAVVVLADRGLWSPRLWKRIRDLGWHPLLRLRQETTFAPVGQDRRRARWLVPGPGHAWVGRGVAFKHAGVRRAGTLLVVWEVGQREPWVVLTDLAPQDSGIAWYGLRGWIELGFRVLKSLGWHWERTRRADPARIARHWLVLAVATLWTLAYGTRAEDAAWQGRSPSRLRTPPVAAPAGPRTVSVFRRGRLWLQRLLIRGGWWQQLWLLPEAWPLPAPGLLITYHATP